MKRRGTGVGCMFYGIGNTGLPNPAAAFVEVLPDTSVNVIGRRGRYRARAPPPWAAAVAAETLGLAIENIHVTWADTQVAPEGGATSRQPPDLHHGQCGEERLHPGHGRAAPDGGGKSWKYRRRTWCSATGRFTAARTRPSA